MADATPSILPVSCVSFPRSGNHLLVDVLHELLGRAAVGFSDLHKTPTRTLDADPTVRFEKNHDLMLDTPIVPGRRTIVQIRHPIDTLVSWFRMAATESRSNVAMGPEDWMTYAINTGPLWIGFVRRWILEPMPLRLVVTYDDLVERPLPTVMMVLRHLGVDPDPIAVAAACAAVGIRPPRPRSSFAFYGPRFFERLDGMFATTPGIGTGATRFDAASIPRVAAERALRATTVAQAGEDPAEVEAMLVEAAVQQAAARERAGSDTVIERLASSRAAATDASGVT